MKRLSIVGVLVILTVIALHGLSVASAQKPTLLPTPVPDDAGLAAIGVRFGKPASAPIVSQGEAVSTARLRAGSVADEATEVLANYVLFSDDQYYSVDAFGQRQYAFQDVPAWVITFRGVYYGRGSGGGKPNTEMNVVINAQTGEYMEVFSYR
jgi:hypothetical protein